MSSRSIGRGICPKCGEEGVFVVKRIGDREYVYARHGRSWHYIGPLNNVDLGSMLNSPTTSLPLKGSAGRTFS